MVSGNKTAKQYFCEARGMKSVDSAKNKSASLKD